MTRKSFLTKTSFSSRSSTQTKASLEKNKQSAESENQELQEELRLITSAKNDSEAKRRKQEQQIQELSAKLQDTERNRNDLSDKYHKSMVSLIGVIEETFAFGVCVVEMEGSQGASFQSHREDLNKNTFCKIWVKTLFARFG